MGCSFQKICSKDLRTREQYAERETRSRKRIFNAIDRLRIKEQMAELGDIK